MSYRPSNDLCKKVQNNLFKIIIIGDSYVGKTAFIRRAVSDFYEEEYGPTVGVDFLVKQILINNEMCKLQLWDVAGQERFGSMTKAYYKDAVGAIVFFDCSSETSFNSVRKWKVDLDNKVLLPNGEHIPSILVANKFDKNNKLDLVDDMETFKMFGELNGFVDVFQTSAKTNTNVNEALVRILTLILQKKHLFPYEAGRDDGNNINLVDRVDDMDGAANAALNRRLRGNRFFNCSCK